MEKQETGPAPAPSSLDRDLSRITSTNRKKMVSGKYSALAGAVSREQAMDNITNNLANINTIGFKRDQVSFESLLRDARQNDKARGINYSRIAEIATDFTPGPMRVTGNTFDVAISGEGFFKVAAGGKTYFTRQGNFTLAPGGILTTESGFAVLDSGGNPITLPAEGGEPITINDNGEINVGGTAAGRIGLYAINDASTLKKAGNGLFELGEGGTAQATEAARLVQGSLELSNVNTIEEMAHMIDNMRKFEAFHQVIKRYDTLDGKQVELGTVA